MISAMMMRSQCRRVQSSLSLTFISCVAKTIVIQAFCLTLMASMAKAKGHDQCTQNPPALCSGCGEGFVEEIGGLKNYVVGSPHYKKGIVLASDVYGYEVPNLRKIADKFAAAGFYVVVPDLLHGDPISKHPKMPIEVWIKSHDPVKGSEESKPIIAALKAKGISAIGAAGFCWGGKVVTELAKTDYIQAAVLLHPAFVTVDDMKEVKNPISILGAEHDMYSPPRLLKQFEQILSSKNFDSKVKVFPRVSHGWTVRYNITDKVAVSRAERAHRIMMKWFLKHVTKEK